MDIHNGHDHFQTRVLTYLFLEFYVNSSHIFRRMGELHLSKLDNKMDPITAIVTNIIRFIFILGILDHIWS